MNVGAYYNEIDPLKAATIRVAIKAGAIAPGDVDERSIADIDPAELMGYTQCHFFAGGGFWSLALRLAGWPDCRPVWTGSCPCPSFSAAGKGEGFDDPRHLWPAWAKLIRVCRPPTIFGEQADDAVGFGWLDLVQTDLEAETYAVGKAVLGTASVGGADIRQRLYFVAESLHAERWPLNVHGQDGRDRQDTGREEAYGEPRTCGEVRELGDPERSGCEVGQSSREGTSAGLPSSLIGGLADADSTDGEWGTGCLSGAQAPGDAERLGIDGSMPLGSEHGSQDVFTSPLNGPWRDADWLLCRDGKWRPVESGTFPLAHGDPARLGRLRLYGDAINVEVAKAFIESYLDTVA